MTREDSGQGPPTDYFGWVRTGNGSSIDSTPGTGNCAAWTSSGSGEWGTMAELPNQWTAGLEDIHVWDVNVSQCINTMYVWCVADDVSAPVYLPIILKNSS